MLPTQWSIHLVQPSDQMARPTFSMQLETELSTLCAAGGPVSISLFAAEKLLIGNGTVVEPDTKFVDLQY